MAKGNSKSDTPTFVDREDVVDLIHQEITKLGEARLSLMMLEESGNNNQSTSSISKIGDLHISDKQDLLGLILKKVKRLKYEK